MRKNSAVGDIVITYEGLANGKNRLGDVSTQAYNKECPGGRIRYIYLVTAKLSWKQYAQTKRDKLFEVADGGGDEYDTAEEPEGEGGGASGAADA